MKNVLKLLAKIILIPLGITDVAAAATHTAFQKKVFDKHDYADNLK